ncbi:MAG TPA: hypothetical protein VFQ54_06560, partial [Thermomicrobiales bacterium]|nr:hypothetical protein [Thermomicrobiales bacterium]
MARHLTQGLEHDINANAVVERLADDGLAELDRLAVHRHHVTERDPFLDDVSRQSEVEEDVL